MTDFHGNVVVRMAELRLLLERKDNEFVYSRWQDREAALADFDAIVESGDNEKLLFLLAPTGSLQEVFIDSGWGDEFCEIAADLERLLK